MNRVLAAAVGVVSSCAFSLCALVAPTVAFFAVIPFAIGFSAFLVTALRHLRHHDA